MQIAEYAQGRQRIVKHLGSAHTEAELGVLLARARELLENPAQGTLELDVEPAPVAASLVRPAPEPALFDPPAPASPQVRGASGRVVGTDSRVLFEALAAVYAQLGFDVVGDEVFADLVIARVVEPTSLLDVARVLGDLGQEAASYKTMGRTLARAQERGYRDLVAGACFEHAVSTGDVSLIMYDVTTLYFEAEKEDDLRKVGYSKERRVDPQIVVGLLVDRVGFPLEIGCFEGDTAETATIVPIVKAFQARHSVADMVVVADAGMLSADNLKELDEANLRFIVGSRMTKAPIDLASHFRWHGDAFTDGQVIDTITPRVSTARARAVNDVKKRAEPVWDPAEHEVSWRAVWAYSAKRAARDTKTLTLQENRAKAVVAGEKAARTPRFVKKGQGAPRLDEAALARARRLVGLSGSPGALLRRGPLRTGHAPFRASGSSKSKGGGGRGEECWQGLRRVRPAPATLPPVVSQGRVINRCPALDFHVAHDGSPCESSQVDATFVVSEHPPIVAPGVESSPVASLNPPLPLIRVRAPSPAPEADPHPVIQLGVDLLRRSDAVVRRPPANDRVHGGDDRRGVGPITSNHLDSELVADPLHSRLRRPGQDLSAPRVAPDREPEEVEPLGQVHDVRLVLVERQPSGPKPFGQTRLDRQGFLARVAHDHEVVRVTDDGRSARHDSVGLGLPGSGVPAFPGGFLHPVHGDVQQQRRDDAPLRCSRLGRHVLALFHDPRLQPCGDVPLGRESVQHGQEVVVADVVERRLQVGVQHPRAKRFPLPAQSEDRLDGVMAAASGPEAVHVRFEAGLPLRLQRVGDHGLDGTVDQRRDAQWTAFAVGLRDVHTPHRRGCRRHRVPRQPHGHRGP